MSKQVREIASILGAKVVLKIPNVGGGAFGAARFAQIYKELQNRLKPGRGKRPGRPTVPCWDRRTKVPMSKTTAARLKAMAQLASENGRKVTATQLAAQLLENAVAECTVDETAKH